MTCSTKQTRRILIASASLLAIFHYANFAVAQSDPNSTNARAEQFHQPVSPFPVEMGFTQHHSSTAFEGAERGRAAVIQAWGNYQLSESQAEIIWQQARALERENNLKRTQALIAQQEMWNQRREDARKKSQAQLVEGKQLAAAKRLTLYRNAYQLAADQFDPTTGAINWPTVLQDARYQQVRERIESLFREQVEYSDPQPAATNDLVRSIDLLGRSLRSDRAQLPRDEYLAASKFLAGLKLEAETCAEAT